MIKINREFRNYIPAIDKYINFISSLNNDEFKEIYEESNDFGSVTAILDREFLRRKIK